MSLKLIEHAYITKETGILGKIFSAITSSGSLEGYLILAEIYYWKFFGWLIVAILLFLFGSFYQASKDQTTGNMLHINILLATVVWGFALSTRVFAFAAGGMVILFGLIRWKQKAILPLSVYTLTTLIYSYISWPFLWVKGFSGLIDSMTIFQDFPWGGRSAVQWASICTK